MSQSPTGAIDILARAAAPDARVDVVKYRFFEPADGRLRGGGQFRLDLCLTARHRTARACFADAWRPNRFEPVGELFVVHPDADLLARSDEADDIISVVCVLEAAPVLDLFDVVPNPTDALLTESLDVRSDRMKSLMRWLGEETRSPSFASALMIELMVGQLRVELIRHGDLIKDQLARGGLAAWQMQAIEDRLRAASPPPSLAELAQLCRISVRQVSRAFRASKGCALGAYVQRRQIEHARLLLSKGESIAAIAAQLGFATSSGFCHAFRRAMGVTPGQYRERVIRN